MKTTATARSANMLWRQNSTRKRSAHRMPARRTNLGRTVMVCVAITAGVAHGAPPSDRVEFNRDIRPIFSDRCYACHGPDQAKRKSQLRLDTEEGAKADL